MTVVHSYPPDILFVLIVLGINAGFYRYLLTKDVISTRLFWFVTITTFALVAMIISKYTTISFG